VQHGAYSVAAPDGNNNGYENASIHGYVHKNSNSYGDRRDYVYDYSVSHGVYHSPGDQRSVKYEGVQQAQQQIHFEALYHPVPTTSADTCATSMNSATLMPTTISSHSQLPTVTAPAQHTLTARPPPPALDRFVFDDNLCYSGNEESGSEEHMDDTTDPSYHPDEQDPSSDDGSDVSDEPNGTSDEDQPLIKRLKTVHGEKATVPTATSAGPTCRSAGRGKCIAEVEELVSARAAQVAKWRGQSKRKSTAKRATGKGRAAAAKPKASTVKGRTGKATTCKATAAEGNLGTGGGTATTEVDNSGATPASANTMKPKPQRSGKAKDAGVTKAAA
jgi:hypothetical protein